MSQTCLKFLTQYHHPNYFFMACYKSGLFDEQKSFYAQEQSITTLPHSRHSHASTDSPFTNDPLDKRTG